MDFGSRTRLPNEDRLDIMHLYDRAGTRPAVYGCSALPRGTHNSLWLTMTAKKPGLPAIFAAACAAAFMISCDSADRAALGSSDSGSVSSTAVAAPDAAQAVAPLSTADSLMIAALVLEVHKEPTCGCCQKWVEHMQARGFKVAATNHPDMAPVKKELGVHDPLISCHTAKIGDYVIEGHVPADDVLRLLREKPAVAGIAAPGMPMGSPGMEGPYTDKYDVVTFDKSGATKVFATHGPPR
jgi:hypothetical protein